MRRTIVENTTGLFDNYHRELNLDNVNFKKENNDYYSCFPGFTFQTEPLWGSTITEQSSFMKSFDEL